MDYNRCMSRKAILFVLCLCFLLQCAESIDPFPHNTSLTSKLQRGYSARRGDYPFTAWILTGKKTYHCGASVIDAEWVLTAAACVQDRDLDAYTFVLGDYKVRKQGDGELRIKADEIILHPQHTSGMMGHDLAMVHLIESIDVQQSEIELVTQANFTQMDTIVINNRQCAITGWGYRNSGKLNKKLQFLPVVMENDSDCSNISSFAPGVSICFSGDPGAPCESDMGSPIVCEVAADQWVQVAVITAGTCDSRYQVASKVMPHETWVNSVKANTFCGEPPEQDNGKFFISGSNVPGDSALLICDVGFRRTVAQDKDATINCRPDGVWTTTDAECIPNCVPPPSIANGVFTPLSGTSLAVLECDENFKPSDPDDKFIECDENGQWSSISTTCVSDTTPGDCSTPPTIANGVFTPVPNTPLAVLECDENFEPSSTEGRFIVCDVNGQWSSTTTTCVPDTTPGDCSTPPTIANGVFTPVTNTPLAVLECDENFEPSSTEGRFIVCDQYGQWSSTSTTCVPDTTPGDCSTPPTIANGMFVPVLETPVAVLVCKENFKPSSTEGRFIVCGQNGQWSSTSTTCVPDTTPGDCSTPPTIANGVFTPVQNTALAVLECNENFEPSSTQGRFIECDTNGQWSSTTTTCVPKTTPGGCGSTGYTFMAGFPKAFNGKSTPYLYTLTRSPTQVVVTVPYYSQSIPYYLVQAAYWYFDRRIVGHGSYEVSTKGIQVQASNPITVIMNQYESGNGPAGDGTLLHPEICASIDHVIITHDQSASTSYRPNVMITGTKSGTSVTLELTNGKQKTATLGRYGTFYYSGSHLIGARVVANHPVIVLAGHQCANVPTSSVGKCDHLLEQMPPISSLQRTYILSYMKPRHQYYIRVIATQANTEVTIRNALGQVEETFQMNQYSNIWVLVINSATISIVASRPILVAQFGQGTQADNLGYGDPSMVVHPGINQWETFYQLYLPIEFYNQHWVIITIRNSDNSGGLRLNDQVLSTTHLTSVNVLSEGNFDVIHVRIYSQINTLSHVNDARFGVMQYGFNNRLEYSWMAGRLL